MEEATKEAFINVIGAKSGFVKIYLHDHPAPDPDAIASALGLSKLILDISKRKSIIVGIPPNHRQNQKMVAELDIQLEDPRTIADFHEPTETLIMVDCTPQAGTVKYQKSLLEKEPDWVIDHHPDKEIPLGLHVDLQSVGSCATIITEYLKEFEIKFNPEDKHDCNVATALMLGLMTDTNNLLSDSLDSRRDVDAFIYLKERYDPEMFTKIMRYDYPVHFFENMQLAYNNKHIAEPFAIFTPGFLKEERLGSVPLIADYWIRRERLTMVTVFAIAGKELIASVRTKEGGMKASDLAKLLFPGGAAGGKKDSAGATVVINGFFDLESLDEHGRQEFLHITLATLVARFKKIVDIDE